MATGYFEMCGCALCAGQSGQFNADAEGPGGGSASTTSKPAYTLDEVVTQLTTSWANGSSNTRTWVGTTVSYSLPDTAPTNSGQMPAEGGNVVVMSGAKKDAAREAFELWDDLIDIDLVETPGSTAANITMNQASQTLSNGTLSVNGGTYAQGTWTTPDASDGTPGKHDHLTSEQIWLNSNWVSLNDDSDVAYGEYGFLTYVHEIGHSLGLSHPNTYNHNPASNVEINYEDDAKYAQDTRKYTVMSYFGGWRETDGDGLWEYHNDGINWNQGYFPQTPMLHDIAAIQAKYGADYSTRDTDTIYGFGSNAGRDIYDFAKNDKPILTLWDGGGRDWLDVSGWDQDQTIDLREGHFSSLRDLVDNVAIAYGAKIEDATGGSGDDTMYGNGLDNVLNGFIGADTMSGFSGDDTYYVNDAGDSVIEYALVNEAATGQWVSGGTDLVYAFVDHELTDNVENLTLTGEAIVGIGNELNNVITGNALDNELYGEDGHDTLNGGRGADTMAGGIGGDTYYVDNEGDEIVEYHMISLDGTPPAADWVYASINYALGDDVEHLTLEGDAVAGWGNALNNFLIGSDIHNNLFGEGGADVLIGGGGDDFMAGGSGDDTYYVDRAGDVVFEYVSNWPRHRSGVDLVYSNASDYTLSDHVENLTLLIDGVNGTGNDAANIITGNDRANTLRGMGGSDTIDGGIDDGQGADVAVFQGSRSEYAVTLLSNGGVQVVDSIAGRDATDLLFGIETLRFSDGDIGANEAATIRGGDGYDLYYAPDTTSHTGIQFALSGKSIEYVYGNDGNDVLDASGTADYRIQLLGGYGNDTLIAGDAGSFAMHGGAGFDTAVFAGNQADYSTAVDPDGWYGWTTVTDNASGDVYWLHTVESLQFADATIAAPKVLPQTVGTADSEGLVAATAAAIYGNAGNDQLTGSSENDILVGDAGADQFRAGGGNDVLYVDNDDTLIDGGEGYDAVYADDSRGPLGLNLKVVGTNVELVYGGMGDDVIDARGTKEGVWISGGWGSDVLYDGEGADWLSGDEGVDPVGIDSAVFAGNLADYSIGHSYGAVELTNKLTGVSDWLESIERLQFADGVVELNDDNAVVDDLFYYGGNPDVWAAGVDPDAHYAAFGWKEGRDPNAFFSTNGYLSANADVKAAGVNPLEHYHSFGWKEGRDADASFDTELYLLRNPDVKAAGVDPLEHFLAVGREGRAGTVR